MEMSPIISVCLAFALLGNVDSQEIPPETGVSPYLQPTNLVTVPTSGVIPRGAYAVKAILYHGGGIIGGVSAGISKRLMMGIYYGAAQVIGDQKVDWNSQPGVELKYRIIDESQNFPAFLVGFNSQGYGPYSDSLKRYETKAMGLYLVASKNYRFLGNLGIHGGINYNPLETGDGDKDPSLFIGLNKDINPEIYVVAEYDAALNDNQGNEFGLGKGYLNAGLRFAPASRLYVEIDFNNILLNREGKYLSREIKINFIEFIEFF